MKKVYRKRILKSVVILLPLILVAGAVLYVKLRGFREALEELVESESSGEYSLTIGKSAIDITDLSFTFHDLAIQRNKAAVRKGIRVVKIPYLQIQFGSATEMLALKRFDIERFVMNEPIIEADAPGRALSRGDDIILAQQIVQLYPAIQSLLGRFDIQSLTINRASVGVSELGRSVVRLGLVDLLVKHWDMRQLTGDSQLLLKVGGQDLSFGKANLNFSGIEYNFQKHHLIFSDFNFSSTDTISNSNVIISGKSLVLQELDYKDLYENKRYSIKRAEVVNPIVSAHFKLKKRITNVDSKSVITRLVRHTLGECSVDSAVIRDARVNVVLQQDTDSVRVQLSRVNFKLHAFEVLSDSNTFQVGGIEVDLNRTAIALKKDMSLQCDRIFFDTQRNLGLTQVMFFDSAQRKTIARCEKLSLQNFDLLDFIFYKHIVASAVSLENGFLQVHGFASHFSKQKRLQGIRNVAVQHVSLKNVALRYSDALNDLSADHLSIHLNRVRRDTSGAFRYNIESVHLQRASVRRPSQRLTSQIKNLHFDGDHVRVGGIVLRRDSLDVQISEFTAEKLGPDPIQKSYRHWKSASMKSLRITGRLSETGLDKNYAGMDGDIGFGKITIGALVTDLTNKGISVEVAGTDLQVNDVTSSRQGWKHGHITGIFSKVQLRTPSLDAKVANVKFNFPSIVATGTVDIESRGFTVHLPAMSLRSIGKEGDHWSIEKITTGAVTLLQGGHEILRADSVQVAGSQFPRQSEPSMAKIEIFKPQIFLSEGGNRVKGENKKTSFPIPQRLIIHPGTLHLSDKRRIDFGKVEGDIGAESLNCSFIKFETPRTYVRIDGVAVDRRDLTIAAVHLSPNKDWFKANRLEDDLIKAGLFGIRVNDFYRGDFFDFNVSKNLEAEVANFEVDISRDKRQDDPPEKEKPPTLDGLIKRPMGVNLKHIDIKRGRLRYTETSEKTSADGMVVVDEVFARVEFDTTRSPSFVRNMKAQAKLYNAGMLDLHYETIDSTSFKFALQLKDFDLTHLNHIVVPLQSLQIKSGYLNHYHLDITADSEKALGTAVITYKDLHLEIFKPTEPEKRTLGTELLTLLADGIILKHSKKNALAPVEQSRVKHKSIFNYWVKSAVHGAMGAIRKGKSKRPPNRA
ncbi:MAG TPA: hypothetical protein VFZ52_03680 [Chryseolinea sp.]